MIDEAPYWGLEFYPGLTCPGLPAVAGPATFLRQDMVTRVRAAYAVAAASHPDMGGAQWQTNQSEAAHAALLAGDAETAEIYSDPLCWRLFSGFHDWAFDGQEDGSKHVDWLLARTYEALVRLSEALGALPFWNPAGGSRQAIQGKPGDVGRGLRTQAPGVEELLTALDAALGWEVDFPNPFPGEYGLASSRGVIHYRALQAIYQAWLLRENESIMELGAGLGRTAYYAYRLGAPHYVLVDLPLTGVAQACFLTAALGPNTVRLPGESGGWCPIEIMTGDEWLAGITHHDLALNADSLPEMGRTVAAAYARAIRRRCGAFLSINSEGLPFRVSELFARQPAPRRHPYWMRAGYVEELYNWRKR